MYLVFEGMIIQIIIPIIMDPMKYGKMSTSIDQRGLEKTDGSDRYSDDGEKINKSKENVISDKKYSFLPFMSVVLQI